MSQISDDIFNRLNSILPLAARQAALPPSLQSVHRAFLKSLVERGRVPADGELTALAPGGDVFTALWTLTANDLLVNDWTGTPIGAYPVTLDRTPHQMKVNGNYLYAMCAFDAIAVAPMFDTRVETWTRCPITGREIHIQQDGRRIIKAEPGADVQIGIWWRDPRGVAARNLCTGIMAMADTASAVVWQAGRTEDHAFAGLEDAIDVAVRFFRPLMTGERVVPVPAAPERAVSAST